MYQYFRLTTIDIILDQFSSHCKPALVPYQGNVSQLLIVVSLLMSRCIYVSLGLNWFPKDCPTLTPNILNAKYNGMNAYDTNDLLIQHPTIPKLWRVYGRCDEQLTHSTGEKVNPHLRTVTNVHVLDVDQSCSHRYESSSFR